VGAELDPREERLEAAEEVAIVLFWILTVSPNLRAISYAWNRIMPGSKISGHVFFFFVLSFSSFISIIDSHPIPKQLIESFPILHLSFRVSGTRKLDGLRSLLPGKSIARVYGYGRW
jgi:hypothetical protein